VQCQECGNSKPEVVWREDETNGCDATAKTKRTMEKRKKNDDCDADEKRLIEQSIDLVWAF
jgi:hypothetical protein